MTLTIGSLFSGIGGLDLGIERATGARLTWACEAGEYPRSVLAARWPDARLFEDVRDLHPPACDILCGGFPCQDVSLAGKGAGLAGARSGLWFEMHRIVSELCPRVVVIENVGTLVKRGLATVTEGLAALGYTIEWQTLTALAVGALHIRSRVFVVAHRLGRVGVFRDPGLVSRAFAEHRSGLWAREPPGVPRTITRAEMAPSVRRKRLQALGNAVVPQVADVVGRCIAEAMERPQSPCGWHTLGVVVDGSARTLPDLFGASKALDMPSCGALAGGLLYETSPLCDLRMAKARHAETPGPFDRLPTPRASDGEHPGPNQRGSKGDLTLRSSLALLPTPTAGDAVGIGSRNTATSRAHPGVSLTDAVRGDGGRGRGTVPTPTRSMETMGDMEQSRFSGSSGARPSYRDANSGIVPTPTATEYGSNQGGQNPGAPRHSLGTMARRGVLPGGMAPAPRASDWRSGHTSAATAAKNARPLCEVIAASQADDCHVRIHRRRGRLIHVRAVRIEREAKATSSGHLNPAWVAWLMGFPPGWFE